MRRSKLLLACAAALVISTATLNSAQADWHMDHADYFDDDGDWVEFWSDGEGHTLIFVIEDYETIGYVADGFDNPNPEEGSGTERDWGNLEDILKKYGAGLERLTDLAGTPLGHQLLRGGHLVDPYHNPSDVGYEDAGGLGGGGGGGFTPGNGSPTEQLKRHIGKGNKSKGDGEDDLESGEVGLFDDDMPGPPELVNPNPTSMNLTRDNGGKDHDGRQGGHAGGNGPGGGGNGGGGGAAGAAR